MEYKWADIKVMLHGKEYIAAPVTQSKTENKYSDFEYYMRRGNKYYFRTKSGGKTVIESDDKQLSVLRYGHIVNFNTGFRPKN